MTSVYLQQEHKIARLAAEWRDKPCNISELARVHNVPYQRLRHRMIGKHPAKQPEPLNATLSRTQEEGLIQYINFLDTRGSKARLQKVESAANKILYNSGQDRVVGEKFVDRFLKRHPEFLVRKQKPLAVARKNAHDLDALLERFEEYKEIRRRYNILDADTWNFDETGFRIGVGRAQFIVTQDAHRQLTLQDPDNREFLTSIETINAVDTAAPPYLILSGRQMLQKWFEATDLDENASFDTSDTGYSNDEISMRYLEHFHENAPPVGEWRMLVMDGHGSHVHNEFAARCQELKIIPFQLLAHTTHLCQPLDVGCFQPLKHYHCQAIDTAVRLDEEAIYNKTDFLATFQAVRERAFTPVTIKSAWEKTGLVPYNPDVVLDKIRAQVARQRPRTNLPSNSTPTISHRESTLTRTPKGASRDFIATYKIYDRFVKHCIRGEAQGDSSASLSEIYDRLSKGVQAKLHAGALAEDRISAQSKAVAARKQRNQNNRRLTSDGRLTVRNARAQIKAKNLQREAQSKAAEEKRQARDYKIWYSQLRQIVFNNEPVSKTYPKPGVKTRGFPLREPDLKCWRTVIRQLDTPHREREALEKKRLDDEWCVAACNALNPVHPLSSSPPRESGPAEDTDDEEAFGFMPLPARHTYEELRRLMEPDMDDPLDTGMDTDVDE